jgi:hypothetical protein
MHFGFRQGRIGEQNDARALPTRRSFLAEEIVSCFSGAWHPKVGFDS